MTSDYGAATQLEKIDMLDFAELVVLNKFDKRGAEDALRDVRKQWKRNRIAFQTKDEDDAGLSDHRQRSSTIPASPGCSRTSAACCARSCTLPAREVDAATSTPR